MKLLLRKLNKKKEIDIQIEFIAQDSPSKFSLRGISVISEETAWLSGAKGTILRTIDGGENWTLITPPDDDSLGFRSIHAFNEREGIVASAGFPSRIYKTSNAGVSWDLVYENLDSAAFINSIAFKSANEGLAFGDQINGRHLLLETNDGGTSWSLVDSNLIPKPLQVENGFAASNSCIAIDNEGNYFIGLGGDESRVFSCINNSWEANSSTLVSGPSAGIYSIAFGNNRLLAVGGDYTQADSTHYASYSDDLGKSWKATKGQIFGYRSVVDYSEKDMVWITGGTNGLDYSLDNGMSWHNFSDQKVNTLRFAPNSSKAFIANSKGEIFSLNFSIKKD